VADLHGATVMRRDRLHLYVICVYFMKAKFVELPPFQRWRRDYLDDGEFAALQEVMMRLPEVAALIPGSGGLRKLRVADSVRQKGKRGGLRVIYYWWAAGSQFWLFTVYGKGEMSDLTKAELATLKAAVKAELAARRGK
jgi:hypothetical protein